MLEEQEAATQEPTLQEFVAATNLEETILTIEVLTTATDDGASIRAATVETVSTEAALEEDIQGPNPQYQSEIPEHQLELGKE